MMSTETTFRGATAFCFAAAANITVLALRKTRQEATILLNVTARISNQFTHWLLIVVHEELRTASQVVDGGFVYVNAHTVVERGKHFLEMHRAFRGLPAKAIG